MQVLLHLTRENNRLHRRRHRANMLEQKIEKGSLAFETNRGVKFLLIYVLKRGASTPVTICNRACNCTESVNAFRIFSGRARAINGPAVEHIILLCNAAESDRSAFFSLHPQARVTIPQATCASWHSYADKGSTLTISGYDTSVTWDLLQRSAGPIKS